MFLLGRIVAEELDNVVGDNAVSPIFEVSIRISAACVNGQADFETLAVNGIVTPTFCIVECACTPGWIG